MGAAALSISDRWRLSDCRSLCAYFGVRPALNQQCLFCAHLYPDFPDRAKVLQRKGCSVDGMGLGSASFRHVLVHAMGVGDEPRRASAGCDFLAHAENGGT